MVLTPGGGGVCAVEFSSEVKRFRVSSGKIGITPSPDSKDDPNFSCTRARKRTSLLAIDSDAAKSRGARGTVLHDGLDQLKTEHPPVAVPIPVPIAVNLAVVFDPLLLRHRHPARKHPEKPERISSVMEELAAQGILERCTVMPAVPISFEALHETHSPHYVSRMEGLLGKEAAALAAEAHQFESVYLNEHSVDCARRAAGGLCHLTAAVIEGRVKTGFALIRPPGHHAETHGAMGFCLFNNVAVAAKHARALGVSRVLIVDWDVHHGNGTQAAFLEDPSVLYFSIHRHDSGRFFPGSKNASHSMVGTGAGVGYTVNVAWEGGGAGDAEYLSALTRILLPIARSFQPQLVLVSAGFDAALGDTMGGCCVTSEGYAAMTRYLLTLAGGRVVMALEGGYSLTSLRKCVSACCEALLSGTNTVLPSVPTCISPSAERSIMNTLRTHEQFWAGLSTSEAGGGSGALPMLEN